MNALTTRGNASLEPQTLPEAMKFAEMLAGSTMVPRDYQGKPANILVAIQWGREVGLGPLQALQNIAVINNRPSIWGDAAAALVRGHPACAGMREGVDGEGDARHGWCEVTRRGEQPQRREFSVADAKRAGLWGKQGPWQQYPDRMLQLRARGFALRDVFPDALRGVITAEEAEDLPPDPRAVPNLAAEPVAPAPAPPPDAEFPWIAMDGTELQVSGKTWIKQLGKALSHLREADAIRLWHSARRGSFNDINDSGSEGSVLIDTAERAIAIRIAEIEENAA
jgi:hypothetical protein